MKWGAYPHPFLEVVQKARLELNHQVNLSRLRLVGFGVDARKLYFQFSFFEPTDLTFSEIAARAPDGTRLQTIAFERHELAKHILQFCWEPAAEATILTMCFKEFGAEATTGALARLSADWWKREMRDEWDYRASRGGPLAVMSVRYRNADLQMESKRYVDSVMSFIGDRIADRDVLEVGSGTGRIMLRIAEKAATVTGLDLCQRMLDRAREATGRSNVSYTEPMFGQDYRGQHDIVVCSLVLIHNVTEREFGRLMDALCRSASERIFVFEDISEGRRTSAWTVIRTEREITEAFAARGFARERASNFDLCGDQIAFLEFCRSGAATP